MIDTWSPWVAIIVAGSPILLAFFGIAYSLYLGRHLDAMMEALKNSRFIYIWGPSLRKQGWFGCLALISRIAGMVVWSRASIRLGHLDPVDIQNFPPRFKRMLLINLIMIFASLIGMAVVAMLVQFR
jgi:hypothetical protein